MGVHPQLLFLLLEWPTSIGPSPIFQEHWALLKIKAYICLPPQKGSQIPFGTSFYTLYALKLDCGQKILDKIEVLLGTSWGTLGAWWKHKKTKDAPLPTITSPKTQKKKTKHPLPQVLAEPSCWQHKISISKTLSSFSTWVYTLIINWGYF
jgi:hypothetical protein